MSLATYEPPPLEIKITLTLGLSVLSPYYSGFIKGLNLRGDERVLDFGSGSGVCSRHIAACLKRGGGRLDCVDISRGWMNVIRKTLRRYDNVDYHLGHISQLNLSKSTFDLVVIHFVLHDIPAPGRPGVVHALARVIKPAGRLVLREPQGEGLALDEVLRLTADAGLNPLSVDAHKIAIGSVYDAAFARGL